ncbi:MAG TPA: anhydro-N-acetylmuramic acid kinase [Chitinophagaceae bacterium]|nr:anhydro-N-acetylmuramic acid kinase [Chitinophagaceae bacterium]
MVYKVIGLMSGSSLDGLDIVFTELQETGGKWNYEIINSICMEYDETWQKKLKGAIDLQAVDYLLLHTEYGKFIGEKIKEFIGENNLQHKVNLVSSHGHTTFHLPEKKMTHQLGEGAAIASETNLPVISDLRSMDIAFGGQGAPIVPIGEKLLFTDYNYFLNIGGIANLSIHNENTVIAFDVCAANRVLNMLAEEKGLPYDDEGKISAKGNINNALLEKINSLEYFKLPYPKSLANSFGTDVIFPIIKSFEINTEDALSTFTEHICIQIKNSLKPFKQNERQKLFITGGGAFNTFLIKRLNHHLEETNFEIHIPEENVVKYKEALIMALLGILRWREQYTVLASVTGASRNSVGGAIWLGTDA